MPGRTDIAFDGILNENVTYLIDNSTITYDSAAANGIGKAANTGLAVMLSAAKTVALTSDAARVVGKLLKVERDGKCSVQVEGYCELSGGLSATLTAGTPIVGATGTGGARGHIRTAAAATLADVAAQRGQIVDPTTATEVVVKL